MKYYNASITLNSAENQVVIIIWVPNTYHKFFVQHLKYVGYTEESQSCCFCFFFKVEHYAASDTNIQRIFAFKQIHNLVENEIGINTMLGNRGLFPWENDNRRENWGKLLILAGRQSLGKMSKLYHLAWVHIAVWKYFTQF